MSHNDVLKWDCNVMQDEVEEDENGYRRRERFVGKWERRFQLPENVSPCSFLAV